MCNRDNAHGAEIFPDEKIAKGSEPTNQAQTKINIAKSLKTYLNDLKNYLTTYQFHQFPARTFPVSVR